MAILTKSRGIASSSLAEGCTPQTQTEKRVECASTVRSEETLDNER